MNTDWMLNYNPSGKLLTKHHASFTIHNLYKQFTNTSLIVPKEKNG